MEVNDSGTKLGDFTGSTFSSKRQYDRLYISI